ncbi:hypothetical protein [Streptomyces sp. NPDC093094]|uniref:hypothetical protein n=1 Tax=Streptomyces sp. NPDC093094 TaxID=3366026 RepID=UPI0037FDD805
MTDPAVRARAIAGFLTLPGWRAQAAIVHHQDANFTGIRFATKAGWVVLEIPAGDQPYRLVHELPEPDAHGRTEVEMQRFPQVYKPRGIAHITMEFLLSRGFLG